ncbi:Uncharacterised protein [Vibrio cholerae]|nr:Uncharacterised protein [Vibrio cholerae]
MREKACWLPACAEYWRAAAFKFALSSRRTWRSTAR